LNNPALTRAEFVEVLSQRFNLGTEAGETKAALLKELEGVLRERRARGLISALVIDEAQSLSPELLEEVRLLANIETTTEKLLPLVLAGQPELGDRLNEVGLRQLKQRVALRCEISPFNQDETAAFIAHRVRVAGGDAAALFTREAVKLIHLKSGGIPRVISVMCDNALLTGCGLNRRPVDSTIVLEVSRDFDLGGAELNSETGIEGTVEAAVQLRPVDTPTPALVEAEALPAQRIESMQTEPQLFGAAATRRRFSFFGGR